MLKFNEYVPTSNHTIKAKTIHGIRYIKYIDNEQPLYTYVDCIDGHCNPLDILEWEYVNKEYMTDMFFNESWVPAYKAKQQSEINYAISRLSGKHIK